MFIDPAMAVNWVVAEVVMPMGRWVWVGERDIGHIGMGIMALLGEGT